MSDRTLLWQLFEMVKELMPASEANAKRFAEWAAAFHGKLDAPTPIADRNTVATDPQSELDDLMDEPDDDDDMPHVRAAPKRKKR